ncbi:right-handed parallel beta-helix repeat-containing protein [Streptomyces pakalii]|uniref:Glycosyl hydrolase family 28-related protein n=1 Tax=Streptomyces pakalii TaxID=3036494 RepID=A0ABT7DI75_9ACTN|nr:right-handed parallel beta-helix repeat-containing protein [Streptomyces pakalii]MDJ1645288.1 glycosyl hydrolase family 28-related protein [Streptomyces pakalii]
MSIQRAHHRPRSTASTAALLLALTGAVSYGTAAPPPARAATTVLEAESAALSGGARSESEHTGYTGTGYVGGYTDANKGSAATAYTVRSTHAGDGAVKVRYANGTGSAKTLTLAQGTTARQISLPATNGWTQWATIDLPVTFAQGSNLLTLKFTAADSGNVNIDSLTATTPDTSGPGEPAPGSVGATLPFTTYEAESGTFKGTAIGPDRTYLTLASEASGRKAVQLTQTGDHVEITLTRPANAINLRYSLPDSSDGKGIDATLSAYADGTALPDLGLTSRYAWVYGAYPYTNNPGEGQGHRFFDETRLHLGRTLPAGTVLRLQKDSADTASSYTIDLIEAEETGPAAPLPDGYVSAAGLGVTPDDGQDDTAALQSALGAAKDQGKGLFLPAGTYVISDHVNLSGMKLRGAGVWHTALRGTGLKGGLFGRGGTSVVENLTIDGQNTVREDAGGHAAIEGDFGTGSVIKNVWIQHTKVGLWITGPTDGLTAEDLRIRNTYADGVNLHGAVRNTVISNSSIRGTGDDALAMWSEGAAVTNSTFRNNTVQLPTLANGAAVYGGSGNRVENNLISDTVVAAAGITVSTRFGEPFSGTTTVSGNLLRRTGSMEVNWNSKLGALWVYADRHDITQPIVLTNNTVEDSTYSGLLLSWQKQISDLRVSGLTIDRTGHHGIEVNASGTGSFTNTRVASTVGTPLDVTGGFTIQRGSDNSGW